MFDTLQFFVTQFFEKAGFFFVPILAFLGFLHLKSLKPGKGKGLYLFFSSALLLIYILFGMGSSRYLLIPLLFWGLLAGAGLEFCVSMLCRIPQLRRIPANVLILLAAAALFIGSAVRVFTRNTNDVIPVFTRAIMNDDPSDGVIYCIGFRNASKLRGMEDGLPRKEVRVFELLEDAVRHFIKHQYESKAFYFCVEFPHPYNADDFKSWFRSCYYIYPFDILQKYSHRRKNYLLLKFNRKTGVKTEHISGVPMFRSGKVRIHEWKYGWKRFPVSEILAGDELKRNVFFEANPMRQIADNLYFRNTGTNFPPEVNITAYNSLLWPEEVCRFSLISPEEAVIRTETPPPAAERKADLPSGEQPLLLIPPYLFVTQNEPDLFFSGAVPAYRHDIRNIKFADGREKITVTEKTAEVILQVTEQGTGQSASGTVPVRILKPSGPSDAPSSVLFVDDVWYKQLSLREKLSAFWGQNTRIDCISQKEKTVSSLDAASYSGWSAGKYQAVILNILLDPVYRPWSFPFQTGPATDEMLTGFVRKVHELYPGTPCFVILPPAPTDRPSFFSPCFSPQLSRLSHYRVCDAVQRWYLRTKPENVHLIPLYFCVDPDKDYPVHLMIDGLKTYSGLYFRPHVNARFAEIIGACVLHYSRQNR